jgi:hypothetical protein
MYSTKESEGHGDEQKTKNNKTETIHLIQFLW